MLVLLLTLLQTYCFQSQILFGDYVQAPPWLLWKVPGFQPYPTYKPKHTILQQKKGGMHLLSILLFQN